MKSFLIKLWTTLQEIAQARYDRRFQHGRWDY
jgi:hypothetical protein